MKSRKSKKGGAQKASSSKAAAKRTKKAAAKAPVSSVKKSSSKAAASQSNARPFPTLSLVGAASADLDKLIAAKESWAEQLLRPRQVGAFRALGVATSPSPEDNVVGVGIGEKISEGRHTGITAVKFLVRVKYGDDMLTSSERLPKNVDGLPTDIEEVGTFRRFEAAVPLAAQPNPRTMIRPAPPGCSIGFQDQRAIMAGTFGALVRRGQRLFILSNNHVLADENRLPIGALTLQPGVLDAGSPPTTGRIGRLSAFVQLRAGQPNFVDCAISEVDDRTLVTNSIIRIGVPRGAAPAQGKMTVHKFGRTTGYRVGFIEDVMVDVLVDYDIGTLRFNNQIRIKGLTGQQFSDAGDSGSLIVERNTGRAVGLLFAGSETDTLANHIGDVFQALNVRLA